MKFRKSKMGETRQCGQGLTEYAVILSLIAVASIAAAALFGGSIRAKIASLTGAISGQSVDEIKKSDDRARSAADLSSKASKKINGMKNANKKNQVESGSTLFDSLDLKD